MISDVAMDFNSISTQELFSNALVAFQDSLPSDKRDGFQQYPTAVEMLGELKLYLASVKGGKIERSCNKIAAFSQKLNSYFNIVGAFVQTNSEYAGWFWGYILLICKLGCNYSGFFERTSEMLHQISAALPQYHDYIQLCNAKDIPNDRLAKSLSLVYADIVDFCQQMYTMLSQRRSGIVSGSWRRKVAFIGRVMWSPFNERFAQLLERIRRHEAIFGQEMSLYNSKVLSGVRTRLDLYYEALQKSLSKSFIKIDDTPDFAALETLAKSKDRQVQTLKEWIGATDFRTIFENAKRRRRDCSGEWFLCLDQYRAWRDAVFQNGSLVINNQRTPKVRVVQAKPGYGKTFLSSTIIEDLQQRCPSDKLSVDDSMVPVTAFFHFNRTSNVICNCSAAAALRAILAQLVNLLRDDTWVLDALAVLKGSSGSGQLEASFEDTLAALTLLIETHPIYLVVDGVDECMDHDVLFTALFQLCSSGDCRVLLLGRPDLSFPRQYSDVSMFIRLKTKENFEDILGLVCTELDALVLEQAFGNRPISPNTAAKAACQANGIFLWAQLFISYLRSPALTPKLRHQFLADVTKFSGLDGLIIAILTRLDEGSQHAKDMALRVFSWVGAAFYPLSTEALHTALAITPGEETTDLDYLVDFPDCLPVLTGALVEIDLFGRPAFIHLCVRELLASPRSQVPASFTLADTTAIHGRLSTYCLSYLTHDIPKKPIRALVVDQTSSEEVRTPFSQLPPPNMPLPSQPSSIGESIPQQDPNIFNRQYPENEQRKQPRLHSPGQKWERDLPQHFGRHRHRQIGHPRDPGQHEHNSCLRPQFEVTLEMHDQVRPESFYPFPREPDRIGTITGPMMVDSQHRNHRDHLRAKPSVDVISHIQGTIPFKSPLAPELMRTNDMGQGSIIERTNEDRQQSYQHLESSQEVEDISAYPFLRYTTLCWAQHTWASFHVRHRNPMHQTHIVNSQRDIPLFPAQKGKRLREALPVWVPFISRFLFCKPAVTNWTESSFHYKWTPSIHKVMAPLKELISEIPQDTPETRELHWISLGLGQLAAALDELAQKHRSRLHSNPTLIWQRDITSATDEGFWPVWAEVERSDGENMPNGCWTGEAFLPGQTLTDLASFQDSFSGFCK